jgi:hypothetical protein
VIEWNQVWATTKVASRRIERVRGGKKKRKQRKKDKEEKGKKKEKRNRSKNYPRLHTT